MWQYKCPICDEIVRENKGRKEVLTNLSGNSHRCPNCNGLLFVTKEGYCVDYGLMIARALEVNTGVIISREEALRIHEEAHHD